MKVAMLPSDDELDDVLAALARFNRHYPSKTLLDAIRVITMQRDAIALMSQPRQTQ